MENSMDGIYVLHHPDKDLPIAMYKTFEELVKSSRDFSNSHMTGILLEYEGEDGVDDAQMYIENSENTINEEEHFEYPVNKNTKKIVYLVTSDENFGSIYFNKSEALEIVKSNNEVYEYIIGKITFNPNIVEPHD